MTHSSLNLTEESDRLVALTGVAARWQYVTGWTYLAGVWKETLLRDLCWRRSWSQTSKTLAERRPISWSWVSMHDKVAYEPIFGGFQVHALVVSARITPVKGHSAYGQIDTGEITIKAPLRRAFSKKPKATTESGYGGRLWISYEFAHWSEAQLYPDQFPADFDEIFCADTLSFEVGGEPNKLTTALALVKSSTSFHRISLFEMLRADNDRSIEDSSPELQLVSIAGSPTCGSLSTFRLS